VPAATNSTIHRIPACAEPLAGALEKYAKLVDPANLGAVTHSGAVDWPDE